jgi:predicted acetylornithine/succinylornithine family transaminase
MTFVRGEGSYLWDSEGKRYLDCVAGIAVIAVGHCNPAVTRAIQEQASTLVHVSNLYRTEPARTLAHTVQETIQQNVTVFFANSGAESNECAIKLARKWADEGRYKIICAHKSFHGRTLATLAATGQPAKWKGFSPLPEGFVFAKYNDASSFENLIDSETAAIMVEPVQGEGGIIPGDPEFLQQLRKLCTESNIALIFDEVQTGVGRTGHWWAYQHYGVTPDLLTSAKGLGNGLPIGACIALHPEMMTTFQPGDHATTFGGGPIVCAAASATLECIREDGVLKNVLERSEQIRTGLQSVPGVKEVRGVGLMLGVVLEEEHAAQYVKAALKAGVLLNAPASNVIRIVPPLTISTAEVAELIEVLKRVIPQPA